MPMYVTGSPLFFFFQAEDGIRDDLVTGVQTCALPIYQSDRPRFPRAARHPRTARRVCNDGAGLSAARRRWILHPRDGEIGRASCRERVEMSVGAGGSQHEKVRLGLLAEGESDVKAECG